jgi:hypothetical protein
MPYGKTSQNPVPKAFTTKTHKGMGNKKTVLHTHGAVRGNTSLKAAPHGQPANGNGSPKAKRG